MKSFCCNQIYRKCVEMNLQICKQNQLIMEGKCFDIWNFKIRFHRIYELINGQRVFIQFFLNLYNPSLFNYFNKGLYNLIGQVSSGVLTKYIVV